MRRTEDGFAVTISMLGFVSIVFGIILLVTDGWKIITADQALAGAVDSAASAGANAVDEAEWKRSGTLRLDPGRAEALALESINAQPDAASLASVVVRATPDGITVEADRTVRLMLLRIIGDTGRTVYAAAEATPRRTS